MAAAARRAISSAVEPYVSSMDRIVATAPEMIDKVTNFFKKNKDEEPEEALPPQY